MKSAPRDTFHKTTKLAMIVVIQGIYFYYLGPPDATVVVVMQSKKVIKLNSEAGTIKQL